MNTIDQESIDLHKKYKGKLEIRSKVPLKDKHDLSLAYTPGVGAVTTEIANNPNLARLYTMKSNSVAIVTDGSAILGLGNLGPKAAIPVMEGKAVLFKEFADIDGFPICLDTQDTEEIIKTVKHIAPIFGGINLEDIAAPRCFEIEARLKLELDIPVMHDDQHGTATVVLAGLINSLKLAKKSKEEVAVVINGVGAAGVAVAKLMLLYGFKNLVMCDSKGIISPDRIGLSPQKAWLAAKTNPQKIRGGLLEALEGADIFIGVSKSNLLSPEMIVTMHPNPVIFALANPVPEVMPEVAKKAGAFIIATGRSDFPNQINNVLAFPGIFRGALDNLVTQITDEMLVQAAKNLAACVSENNLTPEKILPDVFDKSVVTAVGSAIR